MIPLLRHALARLRPSRPAPDLSAAELLDRAARGEVGPEIVAGIDALCRLLGEQDDLPDPGAVPVDRAALLEAAARLGLEPPVVATERLALWTWRDRGRAVAHVRMLRRPARIFLDARAGQVAWDLPGLPLLRGSAGPGGALISARVDGRKLRLRAEAADGRWRRELLVQGARWILRDRGLQQIRFDLPPTLRYAPVEGGWNGQGEGLRLEVRADPAWRWTLDEGRLVGHGEGAAAEAQTSLELRT